MAQKTSWTGAPLTESDINTYLMHEGGQWSSWTPAIEQAGSVTATVNYARFARSGRSITAAFRLTVTGSGTTSNLVLLSLPATAASSGFSIGYGFIQDASAGAAGVLEVKWTLTSTTQMFGLRDGTVTGVGVSPALALAAGDIIHGTIVYEAAT